MEQIEGKVRKLVKLLNQCPGVRTSSSCGGHDTPTEHQLPKNEWSVTFDIFGEDEEADLPCKKGWKSLGKLSQAAYDYLAEGDGEIQIVVCNLSDREGDPEGLCNYFELHGYDTDIQIFCNILEEYFNYDMPHPAPS